MKIALIDRNIHASFINTIKSDVTPIFIENDDTFNSIFDKINAVSGTINNLMIAQHLNPIGLQIGREPIIIYNDQTSWEPLKQFLIKLKGLQVQTVDFLACLLFATPGVPQMISVLEAESGLNLRASNDLTGNAEAGGNWIMESDMIDIQQLYFNDNIQNFKDTFYVYTNISMYGANKLMKDVCGNFIYSHKDISGFPINPHYDLSGNNLKYPSSKVITWGVGGGDSSAVASDLSADVVAIYSSGESFAALKSNGKVITWGNGQGANSSSVAADLSEGVISIYATYEAFAALKSNGKVVTWGHIAYGGNSSAVAGDLNEGVVSIYSTNQSFAALKSNGKVVTWGGGASANSSGVAIDLSAGVVAVYYTNDAFAALKSNGKVIVWGDSIFGGDSSSVAADLNEGVVAVYSSSQAFAALKSNGKVITWGNIYNGGDSSAVSADLSEGVVSISYTFAAFAALKSNGKVIVWGSGPYGGDAYGVRNDISSGVVAIYATGLSFAALKSNGKVITWGNGGAGGNSSAVADDLNEGVVSIFSTYGAFAAKKSNGKIITWGAGNQYGGDSSAVSADLSEGVVTIYSLTSQNFGSFAALKNNGKVVTWGNATYGGDSSSVSQYLNEGIIAIYSTYTAFAALKPSSQINLSDYYSSTGGLKLQSFSSGNSSNTPIPCFVAGTQILTPNGEVPVESLSSGDIIITADGRSVPINVFTTEIAKTTALNAPYTIPAKTLSPAQKHSITLSPRHAIQIRKDVWEIPEFARARYPQIKQAASGKPITYYHLECPNYFTDNIVANGIVAESFGARQVNSSKPLYIFNNKVGGFIRNNSNNKSLAKH